MHINAGKDRMHEYVHVWTRLCVFACVCECDNTILKIHIVCFLTHPNWQSIENSIILRLTKKHLLIHGMLLIWPINHNREIFLVSLGWNKLPTIFRAVPKDFQPCLRSYCFFKIILIYSSHISSQNKNWKTKNFLKVGLTLVKGNWDKELFLALWGLNNELLLGKQMILKQHTP